MITEKDIRTAIDEIKTLKGVGNYYVLNNDFHYYQRHVMKFIDEIPRRCLNKNERIVVCEFARLCYWLYKTEYGVVIPVIPLVLLEEEYKRCTALDPFNDYLTDCDLVEDYFKPIIHANEFVKPKFTIEVIVRICAILNCFYLVTQKMTPIE